MGIKKSALENLRENRGNAMKPIVLLGGGGHCKSCIDVIEAEGKFSILGIIDLKENIGNSVLNYKIIDCDEHIEKYVDSNTYFLITLGQIKSAEKRISLYNKLKNLNANIATIISPHAYVSKYANIGEGSIVMHNAIINANVNIGVNCIINTKSLLEHDATVGNHCHISTATILNGEVSVGDNSFVGSNSTVVQCAKIKNDTFIKAGTLVK